MTQTSISFLHYQISTSAIAIGERVKGGTFRPCIENIPTSTLKGCFKEHFGSHDIQAIGFFRTGTFEKAIFTYAPFDAITGTAKLPIFLEYLKPEQNHTAVVGDIYLLKNEAAEDIPRNKKTEIFLGALKSKGFGRCELSFIDETKPEIIKGYLNGRLLEEECHSFGINRIIKPCYGYLFYPTSRIGGIYKRALFEGSIVEGPEFLIGVKYEYDG
jgi:hypothetical protein